MAKPTRMTIDARRNIVATITADLLQVENTADTMAIGLASFVTLMIEQRRAASLHPTAGEKAIELIRDASFFAIEARAKIMQAHEELAALPTRLGMMPFAPECPEGFTTGAVKVPVLGVVR